MYKINNEGQKGAERFYKLDGCVKNVHMLN